MGTTSACAENTRKRLRGFGGGWNYLRVRGEYLDGMDSGFNGLELPPRARRIHGKSLSVRMGIGTTSACAENTKPKPPRHHDTRNYLRVRGEYQRNIRLATSFRELPPRARRIPVLVVNINESDGTTSACAENTHGSPEQYPPTWNYLRVRGEYPLASRVRGFVGELPPRARRIPPTPTLSPPKLGTTSACAENTKSYHTLMTWWWNYLRVRGEYSRPTKRVGAPKELPPRARRIRPD